MATSILIKKKKLRIFGVLTIVLFGLSSVAEVIFFARASREKTAAKPRQRGVKGLFAHFCFLDNRPVEPGYVWIAFGI